jgi:hypothetical protein
MSVSQQRLRRYFTLLALGLACKVTAQTASVIPSRDELITQLEQQTLSQSILATDGPIIRSVMAPLMRRNTALSQADWQAVASELQANLIKEFMRPKQPFDFGFRASMRTFSDADLLQLNQLLKDPLLTRFKDAQASIELQKALAAELSVSADVVNDAINRIVREHHLRLP